MSTDVETSKNTSVIKKDESQESSLSRREFGKIFAGLGLASLAPGMAQAMTAEEDAQLLREKYAIKDGKSPIQIDRSKFKRYDSLQYAFNVKCAEIGKPWPKVMGKNAIKYIKQGKTQKDIDVGSVSLARSCYALKQGASTLERLTGLEENKSLLSWNPIYSKKLAHMAPDETDPKTLTVQTKMAARLYGADLVGCAPLNKDWIYSHAPKNRYKQNVIRKEIVFKDVDEPVETDTEYVIPEKVNNVIVMALHLPREMLQTAPSSMAYASSSLGYSRMAFLDASLAEFIRSLGYTAIPCSNTTGLSVPMAIEAGIGQASRMGQIIAPEFGPNIKLCKVLTDMPLVHDKPIDFGVTEFCDTCKKCARDCPSKAITEGPRSWTPRSPQSQTGVFQWQNDYMKCLEYWMESGNNCSICVASCPFTKGAMWVHDLVGFTIDKMRFMDPVMLGLDESFGYGERRDEKDVWAMKTGTYGLEPAHFMKNLTKGERFDEKD